MKAALNHLVLAFIAITQSLWLAGCADPTIVECNMKAEGCECNCKAIIESDGYIKLSPK